MGIFTIRGSPFPYGDPRMETSRETKKFPYGDSPFPNRICSNLGTNICSGLVSTSVLCAVQELTQNFCTLTKQQNWFYAAREYSKTATYLMGQMAIWAQQKLGKQNNHFIFVLLMDWLNTVGRKILRVKNRVKTIKAVLLWNRLFRGRNFPLLWNGMKCCHCPGVAKNANTRYMSRRPFRNLMWWRNMPSLLIGSVSTRVYVRDATDGWIFLRSYLDFPMCVRVPMIVSTILQSSRWWIFRVGIPHTTWRIHVLGSSSHQSILSGCKIEWWACVVAYSCDKLLASCAILAGISIPPIPWPMTCTIPH